jgi:hypothetical protein
MDSKCGNRKCPWNEVQRHFLTERAVKILAESAYDTRFAYHVGDTGNTAMPGDVSLAMTIPTDEPLLIKPIGMLGNAGEVYGFVGSRLLGHHFTTLFAMFRRHCSLLDYLLI